MYVEIHFLKFYKMMIKNNKLSRLPLQLKNKKIGHQSKLKFKGQLKDSDHEMLSHNQQVSWCVCVCVCVSVCVILRRSPAWPKTGSVWNVLTLPVHVWAVQCVCVCVCVCVYLSL